MFLNKKIASIIQVVAITTWTVFVFLHSSCTTVQHNKVAADLKALKLHSIMPLEGANHTIDNFETVLLQFQYQDKIMYEVPGINNYSQVTLNKQGDVIEDTLLRSETKYYYVVYKKGEKTGLKYDSLNAGIGKRFAVDSFLAGNTITNFEPFFNHTQESDSLIQQIWSNDSTSLVEKYIPRHKQGESDSDSTILDFSKELLVFDFSFSRRMDSIWHLKLSTIQYIFNPKPESNEPYSKNGVTFLFQIEKASAQDKKSAIIRLFDVFDKQYTTP